MVQDLGKRFLISVGIFLTGMNFIAFLMKENGSANKYNPVWQLLDWFLNLEYLICKGIGIGILGAIGLVCLMAVFDFVTQFLSEQRGHYSSINLPEGKTKYHTIHSESSPITQLEKPKTTPLEINSPITPSINADPKPNLQPKIYAPTPEELKKKAIKQIMGKN